jgi:hypothetical protein
MVQVFQTDEKVTNLIIPTLLLKYGKHRSL